MKREDFNIMSNIKIIESLKAELLCIIGDFFKLLTKGSNVAHDALLDCISGAIIILYILGERLGYSYVVIDDNVKKKLKLGIIEEDVVEKDGKDLTRLYSHLKEIDGGLNGKQKSKNKGNSRCRNNFGHYYSNYTYHWIYTHYGRDR